MPGEALKTPGVRFREFLENQHMKIIRLLALHTCIPGIHFCERLCQPQGHCVAERIKSTKNPNVSIWNRTRDLPAWSEVPQPTAPQCTSDLTSTLYKFSNCQPRQINNPFSLTKTVSLHVLTHLSEPLDKGINSTLEKGAWLKTQNIK
jgi:hypothetical protein